MSESKNNKSKLWIYAGILFTSAFIVLLLTAYSQIKLNKSIIDYRSQIKNIEKENDNFELNLNSALEMNKELSRELKQLNEKITELSQKIKASEDRNIQIEINFKKTLAAYEALIKAQTEYERKNYVSCAQTLKFDCDASLLQKEAAAKYEQLAEKSIYKASHQLYSEGYEKYKVKNYKEAIIKFQQSFELSKEQYFSDDCLFFTAYAYYNEKNYELAHKYIENLLNDYPGSSYAKEAQNLLEAMKY